MFGGFRRLLGLIKVTQNHETILVEGIPGDVMSRDISRIWNTSRISTYMFTKIGKSAIEFPLFFAPDVVYCIDMILQDRTRYVSKRVLHDLREKLLSDTWLASTNEVKPDRLNLLKLDEFVYSPLPHQMDFIEFYNTQLDKYNLKGMLFAGAAGSGKTLSALMIANCLDADLVVIVSPKNALERVWESSIQTLYKHKQTYWMASRDVPIKGNERFIIGNYEAIERIVSAMLTRKSKLGKDAKIMIILDESHNLNEIGSLRTQRFIDLCVTSGSNNILELSGTPIKALGAESLPLLRCIDPYFTPDVETRFKRIYGKDASKGLDILQHRLGLVMFKVEKKALNLLDPIIKTVKIKIPNGVDFTLSSVANDMSKFIEQQVKFYANSKDADEALFYGYLKRYEDSLTHEHDKLEFSKYKHNLKSVIEAHGFLKEVIEESLFCNKFEKEKIAVLLQGKDKESFRHVKTLVKYVNLKIQGECLGRVLGKKRIDCHVAMVPYINFVEICESTTKKTIVFTSFVEALRATEQAVRDAGMEPVMVYGDTNKDLNKIIKDFESNPNTNPLVATFNSLSTAVPLIMADTMIMLNAPFRGYIQEQAISRIHRIGADTQTVIYMMSLDTGTEPNLSTRSSDILAWSQKQVEKILGISAPFEITEGFENLEEGGVIKISMESLDICEVIPVSKLQTVTSLSNW